MRASWIFRRYFIPSLWLTITGALRIISVLLASWVVWLVLLKILIWFAWRLLVTIVLHMANSPTRVTNRSSFSCALSWRFFAVIWFRPVKPFIRASHALNLILIIRCPSSALFEQRSLQLSIYLGRLNSEGGTSCFVKLYCGKRFLKTFFTDLINGQKQIRGTHVTRAVLSCWRLLDHASRVELNFVVLLNFDNVLEGPRSTRRNHHCDIGFSH